MKGVAFLTAAAVVVVAACGGGPAAETGESPTSIAASPLDVPAETTPSLPTTIEPATTTTTPATTTLELAATTIAEIDSGGGVDGPVMYWQQREGTESEAAEIIGRIDLDGDCLYVVTDGGRYPVLWEYGTKWQADPAAVVLPGGVRVPLGAMMRSGGGYHNAEKLDSFTSSDEVEALSVRCADSEWSDVAVVQGAVESSVENSYRGGPAN